MGKCIITGKETDNLELVVQNKVLKLVHIIPKEYEKLKMAVEV